MKSPMHVRYVVKHFLK
ncbi:unnamed protein product [Larinioides sclopetarius]|uniref:Uncharacterized protein n=1 Tax=Larinioides sclopetarius TaxID=280406 RepID=A0AAV1ZCG7_9ARAC